MNNSYDEELYARYSKDATALYEIARYLNRESHTVQVRLPRSLADMALASCRREIDEDALRVETLEQRQVRYASATLSLIGLSFENGFVVEGDEVVFTVDAWHVGNALELADEANALGEESR